MSILIGQLRLSATAPCGGCCYGETMVAAAAEIERLQAAKRRALAIADERSKENVALRAKIEKLRAALKPFAEATPEWNDEPDSLCVELQAYDGRKSPCVNVGDFRRAAQALEQREDEAS